MVNLQVFVGIESPLVQGYVKAGQTPNKFGIEVDAPLSRPLSNHHDCLLPLDYGPERDGKVYTLVATDEDGQEIEIHTLLSVGGDVFVQVGNLVLRLASDGSPSVGSNDGEESVLS